MTKEVYLDHAASSHMHPLVRMHMNELYEKKLGNPSSIHRSGVLASLELEKARLIIASRISAQPEEIYFTSGATESNNLILKGLAEKNKSGLKKEILISSIEHSSINQCTEWLSNNGFIVKKIPVTSDGLIIPENLEMLINNQTLLISVIHANNEIGVIQNLEAIGKIAKKHQVFFHADGAQAFCKTDCHVENMNLDFYSVSSHKIHGPKGVGAVYIKSGRELQGQLIGGGQESGIRSGTVPVELISAMAFATKLYDQKAQNHLLDLRKYLIGEIKTKLSNAVINAENSPVLPNIISLMLPGLSAKDCLQKLDKKGIRLSVGSACHSGKKTPSHVLSSIGLNDQQCFECIRISWGLETSRSDLQTLVEELVLIRE